MLDWARSEVYFIGKVQDGARANCVNRNDELFAFCQANELVRVVSVGFSCELYPKDRRHSGSDLEDNEIITQLYSINPIASTVPIRRLQINRTNNEAK